jgi:uncharacterized membrane protein
MSGITPFGLFHTVVSLVSLIAGIYGLFRYGEIRYGSRNGATYVWGTVAACVTGFFIVRHGGFSQAHALGILTLLTLLVAWIADRGAADHGRRRAIAGLAYTATVFFHFIPGFNETLTRVPADDPFLSGPEDPVLFAMVGATFAVFAVFGVFQARRLLRNRRRNPREIHFT